MIASILPTNVACAEQVGAFSGVLFDEELQSVARAIATRKIEFAAGRACARRALGMLGSPEQAIRSGVGREPLWPEGIVGSITHCTEYCAAAVAHAEEVLSIGIDAEPNATLPAEVIQKIGTRSELAMLSRLPQSSICFDRLLFSVKESIYKAWYPLTHEWLGFEEAEVDIDPIHCILAIKVCPKGDFTSEVSRMIFRGRYAAVHGLIMTAVIVEPG